MSIHERADRLAQLESQVNYHGLRLGLYRRLHGSRPSGRLQELERAYLTAQDRLNVANGDEPPADDPRLRAPYE
jgi:hypothetical protein